MGDILWLDTGDRGTGMQIQYNYVILSRALFLEIFSIILCIDLLHCRGEFDCLVLELQLLFSVSQWKTAIFVWAAA